MSQLVIHPATQAVLDGVLKSRPHALLLSGPNGIGLATIAKEYASMNDSIVQLVLPEKDEKVDLEKGVITVDQIRNLYSHTRTLEPKGRTIVIDYVDRMGVVAQNAFLKLLEEPTEGTQFILLTHNTSTLLPTIMSRVQHLQVRPITKKQSEDFLDSLSIDDSLMRTQLLFIAAGLPAELHKLATNSTYFEERVRIVKDARIFASGSPYQRLKIAYSYRDSRADALTLLTDAMKQLQQTAALHGDAGSIRLLGRLEALHVRIGEQANVRLQLSSAALL